MIKDLGTKIAEGIDKFYKAFQKQRVLKTMEEVYANTSEENIPSALLLSELSNKLGGFEPVINSTGKITGYKTDIGGADTVFPFTDIEYPAQLTLFYGSFNDNGGIVYESTFIGKAYAYVTLSGCEDLQVAINGVRMANGKNRFNPLNTNSLKITSATIRNTRQGATITLSKT